MKGDFKFFSFFGLFFWSSLSSSFFLRVLKDIIVNVKDFSGNDVVNDLHTNEVERGEVVHYITNDCFHFSTML